MTDIIVFEGNEVSGKSALAGAISTLGFNVQKVNAPSGKNPQQEARVENFKLLKETVAPTVFDRSWLGEFVYSSIFRNYRPDYFKEVEALAGKHNILYILVDFDYQTARKFASVRSKKQSAFDKEILGDEALFSQIREKWLTVFNAVKSGQKFILNPLNYRSLLDEEAWVKNIVQAWRTKTQLYKRGVEPMYALTMFNPKERFVNGTMQVDKDCTCGHFKDTRQYPFFKKWRSITWGVGNVKNPKAVFIGEAPGMNGCGTTGIPFYFDVSGMLLRQALFEMNVCESEYYMTNISKCNPYQNHINTEYADFCGQFHLVKELQAIDNHMSVPIIALGRTAQRWLYDYNYANVEFMYHPAYYLRTGDMDAFHRDLEAVLKKVHII